MKRFYKTVSIGADRSILLDGRPVRTPARLPLVLPTEALAHAVAEEWEAQGEEVDPRAMPMTGLANAAIDRVASDPAAFAATLAPYAETDTLTYRADDSPALAEREAADWDPILDWARGRYDIHFTLIAGIRHEAQPAQTIARLADALAARDPFALAAMMPLVTISGSLVASLAVAEGALDADAAFDATHLDELWQAELWGEDYLATEARAARKADFLSAARFLTLL